MIKGFLKLFNIVYFYACVCYLFPIVCGGAIKTSEEDCYSRGGLGILLLMHREKLLKLISLRPVDQKKSPCCLNFLTITLNYHTKVIPIDSLQDEKKI